MAIATLSVRLQAQIAEFQAEFKEAAKTTEKFQQDFQATATKASAYGNLIARGLEIGLDMVQRLGEAALDNASKINDLSKKTGLTTATIQEFQHVAGETGATVDQFANAAFKLGTNLAGGSNSVVKGVRELGLSFDDLRSKSPDDQFRIVIKALEDMDDQQEANRLGIALFGRTYREIAVAVAEGYTDLANGARKMSDEQIKRLADAEDAWKRFGRTVVILTGEAIAEAMGLWSDFQRFLANLTIGDPFAEGPKPLTSEQIAFDKSFADLARKQAQERIDGAKKAADAEEDAAERSKKAFEKAQRAAEAYRNSIIKLRDDFSGANLQAEVKKIEEAFQGLTDAQKNTPEVMDRVGKAAARLRSRTSKHLNSRIFRRSYSVTTSVGNSD
jgi:alkylhydroperoxidase/carboxymuconolactone decarboxylase family protein YurZ